MRLHKGVYYIPRWKVKMWWWQGWVQRNVLMPLVLASLAGLLAIVLIPLFGGE